MHNVTFALLVKSNDLSAAMRHAEDHGLTVHTAGSKMVTNVEQRIIAEGTYNQVQRWFNENIGDEAPYPYGSLMLFNEYHAHNRRESPAVC